MSFESSTRSPVPVQVAKDGESYAFRSMRAAAIFLSQREFHSFDSVVYHLRLNRPLVYGWHTIYGEATTLKNCIVCGKSFEPISGWQKCCSTECSTERRRHTLHENCARRRKYATRVCEVCGAEFEPRNGNQKTCSPECSAVIRSSRPARVCENCGEIYYPTTSSQRFCSKSCATSHSNKKKRQAKNGKTLEQWQAEARQCGLSYGKYRCQIEQFGKTFEQLKGGK